MTPDRSGAPLSVDQARQALLALVPRPIGSEEVRLDQALGRLLSESITAPMDVPRYTNAALDGIALGWREALPARWHPAGSAFAGQRFDGALGEGECVRITTGAPLPPGTDTVIACEQLDEHDGAVMLNDPERVVKGQNVRRAGEELAAGAPVLSALTRLDPGALGLIASLGLATVRVVKRPKVALFSTGNEVTEPGETLPPAGIFDANRFALKGLLQEAGARVLDLGILPDDPEAIVSALGRAAEQSDLVLTSAGVSVGTKDFTRSALERLGTLGFWRVALRPGKPLACGTLGARQTPFVGLPGNPVAAMVTFHQFVAPLLARLEGQPVAAPARLTAVLDSPVEGRLGRLDLLRGVYRGDEQGVIRVRALKAQGSGMLTSMVAANCLIELCEERDVAVAGEVVAIQPLRAPQSTTLSPSTGSRDGHDRATD
ncbi:gephyrin-like molybdotransferase Glp [Halomonas sp. GD1P12]|uniref:molybdopterin molybdotransferase MoeA n=1 Tax=Halomonas sp. GD1P12 TaxID=2982691 RepID=UPI0021E45CEA|nr:gephyrin-like molybdotransferase Glp [Halomonas sp. GD1P12]UYG00351.1 molybdopterin molybdotransferase MoeA [Halomonas sp. GD1P12]